MVRAMDIVLVIVGVAVGAALGWFISQSRHAAIAEDHTPPPWYRPHEPTTAYGMVRSCHTCGVQWRGDDLPCWMCGGQVLLP